MRIRTRRTTLCLLLLFITLLPRHSFADLRSDALATLAKLRKDGVAERFAEEMRSLDATVATAEMYYQLNDKTNSERYYQLATQKGALILKRLHTPAAPDHPGASDPVQSPPAASEPAKAASSNESAQPAKQPEPLTQPAPQEHYAVAEQFSSSKLIGTVGSYTVVKRDTLKLVAAKLGVNRSQLISMNRLDPKAQLKEGQVLRYNNRRIVPDLRIRDGLVINIPDRTLYLYKKGKLIYTTAVALGTPTKMDNILWHTPTGKFRIVNKAKDPTWTVPPSIQEEMRREGKEIITSIPPGPENPLGKYAMKTSLPGILIHSTTKPWSIYTYASHGCVRVYPERMEELFEQVPLNSPGEIIYRPVKALVTDEGRILLEVHNDIYAKTKGLEHEVKGLLSAMKLQEKVDWLKVKKVISRQAGVAEEITLDTLMAKQERLPL